MKKHWLQKTLGALLSGALCLSMTVSAAAAPGEVVRDEAGKIGYIPKEQGVYSQGGYTIEKISHPTAGSGELDSILEEQDRGQSYTWSMIEYGDYIYIGTCYNSTFYIYHNNVMNALKAMKDGEGNRIFTDSQASAISQEVVQVAFGSDKFDTSKSDQWRPVIMAVHKETGAVTELFCEREVWQDYPDIFPGYSPSMAIKNYLSGYRMVCEFHDKLYFVGMGNPTMTLVEIDPATNQARIAYHNTNFTAAAKNIANGVHGLTVFDGELIMCYTSDNYDGEGTPGGLIVATDDPSKPAEEWRVIGDQEDFDNLPAIYNTDGLNGGGIWDIIPFHGKLYVTVVTDRTVDGVTNKQGFALYRGEKQADGDFVWTQLAGGNPEAVLPFGFGINYSMACNLWVYEDHLYLGTYNDPMLDLAAVPASGNFEPLYRDLDHSIYLYRMDAGERFEMVAGKDDNPEFPDGPIGNLGAGLGSHSNQYVWRYEVHDGELYVGTYDTSTLTYMFTQLTDGQVANMDREDILQRVEHLRTALDLALGEDMDPLVREIITSAAKHLLTDEELLDFFQLLAGVADEASTENPVPYYEALMEDYGRFRQVMDLLLGESDGRSARSAAGEERLLDPLTQGETPAIALSADGQEVTLLPDGAAEEQDGTASLTAAVTLSRGDFITLIRDKVKNFLERLDTVMYSRDLKNFVYYFGVNYYARQCERGFDLLVSNDGVNFDVITDDGFGDPYNHGLRGMESTDEGIYIGTANPFYATQLWRMYREEALPVYTVTWDANGGAVEEAWTVTDGEGRLEALPVPVREGYRFQGWYTQPEGGSQVTEETVFDADITVYAHWTQEQYAVTLLETGDGASGAGSYAAGTEVTIDAGTRSGYRFDGWTSEEVALSNAGEQTASFIMPDHSVTVTAAWREEAPSGGGSGGSSGGSGTGGSAVLRHSIQIADMEGGTVTADQDRAPEHTKITLTVTPLPGYALETLAVRTSGGSEVEVRSEDGRYTFTMPDTTVKVSASFIEERDISEGETPLGGLPAFTDVAEDHWGRDAINYVVGKGLFQGTSATTFAPNAPTTRGMLMTVLARMDGVDTSGSTPWYAEGMEWAVRKGISDGTHPETGITREQVAVMLYRYAGGAPAEGTLTFADAGQVSGWATEGVRWAVANGILSGKENNELDPQGGASRVEVAQMLYRFSQMG
ncbi:InlB B-repeat-containing protein [Pseudoflavonifractor phocaeensis]|uniref:InlB B-repeat-containing protein n=1 Tax=Pseudoflavonifractor phocaeensis TaxID=1870988 RepID=UPI00195E6B0C|nr:S-layer homology domain-containing protein [Pseudoflavonifractor phocaeensis]MBM6870644.1 S-layer homology domain-containing protein [Pseudoflavonifractor phocaeensis]